jgi:Flp pilus assembly protein TadD
MALGDKGAAMEHAQAARKTSKITPMRDDLWGEVQLLGVTVDWFAKRGNKYLRDGDFERAIPELEVAVSGEQKDPEVWLNYGTALLHAQRHADALQALERAVAETGKDLTKSEIIKKKMTPSMLGKIYTNLGVAATKLGDLESADQHLRKAWELDPRSFDAAYNLAILCYSRGRVFETISFLEKAQKIRPDPKVLQTLEALYQQTGIRK